MPKVDVSTSTIIDCPPHRVAGCPAGPDNVPEWYVNIKSVEWKTARPAVVDPYHTFLVWRLPRRRAQGFRSLRVMNEDRANPAKDLARTHMEIVT